MLLQGYFGHFILKRWIVLEFMSWSKLSSTIPTSDPILWKKTPLARCQILHGLWGTFLPRIPFHKRKPLWLNVIIASSVEVSIVFCMRKGCKLLEPSHIRQQIVTHRKGCILLGESCFHMEPHIMSLLTTLFVSKHLTLHVPWNMISYFALTKHYRNILEI